MPRPLARSYEAITKSDLQQLLDLALEEFRRFFDHRNSLKEYRQKLVAIALCQGAAVHYVSGKAGIKDFDVFFFFDGYDRHLVNRMPIQVDSKMMKFGVHPEDKVRGFQGRRIDFLRRTIDTDLVKSTSGVPREVIVQYLVFGKTDTARELAKKAVIGLWPDDLFGQVLWPRPVIDK